MSGNTSATGGPLTSTGGAPDGEELDRMLARLVLGITGLPPGMVRPRWQEIPPPEPPSGADWCAVGPMERRWNMDPVLKHRPDADGGMGETISRRSGEVDVLASFYGPHADAYADALLDGLGIRQNLEGILASGFVFGYAGTVTAAPDLVHLKWRRRYDLPFVLRRTTERTYRIRTLLSIHGATRTAQDDNPVSVEN